MQKIAAKITDYLIRKEYVDKEDRDFYCFTFESIMVTLINYITMLIIALLFNRVMECVFFIFLLKLLRENMGGVHMKKWYECYIASSLIVAVVICCSSHVVIGVAILLAGYIVSLTIILKFTPCIHPNNPISVEMEKVCRRKAIVYSVGVMIITFVLKYLGYEKYVTLCFYSVMISAFLLYIGKIMNDTKEGGVADEEGYQEYY